MLVSGDTTCDASKSPADIVHKPGRVVQEAFVSKALNSPVFHPNQANDNAIRHPVSLPTKTAGSAGKGVECTVAEGSHSSSVKFGSLDYIQETLPSSQASMLKSLTSGLRDSSVVSVLVKSPIEEQHSSLPDSSFVLRCTAASLTRSITLATLQKPPGLTFELHLTF